MTEKSIDEVHDWRGAANEVALVLEHRQVVAQRRTQDGAVRDVPFREKPLNRLALNAIIEVQNNSAIVGRATRAQESICHGVRPSLFLEFEQSACHGLRRRPA